MRTLDAGDMDAALATAAGVEPSALDAGPFAAIDETLDGATVVQAIGVPGTARPGDTGTPPLGPYLGIVVVEILDGADVHTEILVFHDSPEAASANAEIADQFLGEGTDVTTHQPISTLLPDAAVSVDDSVLVVTVDGIEGYRIASQMLVVGALFPVALTASRPHDRPHGVGDVVLRHEHQVGGVAEGDERVGGGNPGEAAGVAPFHETGDDRLAGPALAPGLVDHDDAFDARRLLQHGIDRERGQPAQVHHPAADAFEGETGGDAQRQVEAVGPRHHEHVGARRGRGGRHRSARGRRPAPTASRRRRGRAGRGCGTARSARGRPRPCRRPRAAAAHVRNIAAASAPVAGDATTRPGMSRRPPSELSLWKWPPKPFW